MDETFYEETFFLVPERSVWEAFPTDEGFACDVAENVLDDIILFEV